MEQPVARPAMHDAHPTPVGSLWCPEPWRRASAQQRRAHWRPWHKCPLKTYKTDWNSHLQWFDHGSISFFVAYDLIIAPILVDSCAWRKPWFAAQLQFRRGSSCSRWASCSRSGLGVQPCKIYQNLVRTLFQATESTTCPYDTAVDIPFETKIDTPWLPEGVEHRNRLANDIHQASPSSF